MEKLIIVGCGPKAIAIAAKAQVLSGLGWRVPEIVIIDKHGPAANWDGTNGYTDGDTILGTTPFEDVGFPYDSSIDRSVDEEMLKFSYSAYLIEAGDYAEWIDRQLTPPSHAMLADYLKWVFKKTGNQLVVGEVNDVVLDNNRWSVTYKDESDTQMLRGDGLVVTGPGDPYGFPRADDLTNDARILNGQNFWHNLDQFKGLKQARVAVIGAGETSAGVVTFLHKTVDKSSQIEIISRHPILFTRNENWMEVMYFSKVMDWLELSDQEKLEIIKHADRGTFSVAAKDLLDSAYNVSTQLGAVESIVTKDGKLFVNLARHQKKQVGGYDFVVEATGFDRFSFTSLFSDKSLFGSLDSIESDMSLKNISPKLHLPGLSAMAQGPGFPNLSCLGLLSERILSSYISK